MGGRAFFNEAELEKVINIDRSTEVMRIFLSWVDLVRFSVFEIGCQVDS